MSPANTPPRGRFITLEGVDGAGKSSHVDWAAETLRAQGITVVATREPGGTALGESLRSLLLHESMSLETETLLMFASRCEHLQQVILPALARGDWVVCDRFTDATYAYQGGGRGVPAARIATLEAWVQGDLQPDLTWFFDVPLAVARERLARGDAPDRFERENADFFERTRAAYAARAEADPARMHRVDSTQSFEAIRAQLAADLDALRHG